MVDRTVNLLLFEDSDEDVETFLKGLERHVESANYRVVRFRAGFNIPGVDLHEGVPFPLKVTSDEHPEVILLSRSGRRLQETKGEWWQREFDAAVLDVYLQANGEPVGHWYAHWFAHADFRGRVTFISKQNLTTHRFNLSNQRELSKDQGWEVDAARSVADGTRTPTWNVVNNRGRPGPQLLSEFFRRGARPPVQWDSAFFGFDSDLGEAAHAFFDLRPFDRVTLHDPARLKELLRAADKGRARKPNVVFIECGPGRSVLTDGLLQAVYSLADGISFCPIFLFFADECESHEQAALLRMNAAVINRTDFFRSPSMWARGAVEHLAHAYENFLKTQPKRRVIFETPELWSDEATQAGGLLLAALMAPLAMARSVDRLAGGRESFAAWLHTRLGSVLNKGFGPVPSTVVRELTRRGLVTEQKTRLLSTPRDATKKGSPHEDEADAPSL